MSKSNWWYRGPLGRIEPSTPLFRAMQTAAYVADVKFDGLSQGQWTTVRRFLRRGYGNGGSAATQLAYELGLLAVGADRILNIGGYGISVCLRDAVLGTGAKLKPLSEILHAKALLKAGDYEKRYMYQEQEFRSPGDSGAGAAIAFLTRPHSMWLHTYHWMKPVDYATELLEAFPENPDDTRRAWELLQSNPTFRITMVGDGNNNTVASLEVIHANSQVFPAAIGS
jgi:hypothetical protein